MPSTHQSKKKGLTASRVSGARSGQGRSSNRHGGDSGKSKKGHPSPTCQELEGPLHDAIFIEKQHRANIGSRPELKPALVDNPKSPLTNYTLANFSCPPKFEYKIYYASSTNQKVFRCTFKLDAEPKIVAMGDHAERKAAERLCALSAIYQLYDSGLLDKPPKPPKAAIPAGPQQVELSDGSVVDYERARSFMAYYCRIFGFGNPVINFIEQPQREGFSCWEAVMRVDGRRIGMGTANNKKNAQIQCYLDVTKYLQGCDPDLWNKYIQAAKTGKDLGLASKVYLPISSGLSFAMEKLCGDIEKSTLHQNSRNRSMCSDASQENVTAPALPLPSRRYFPPFAALEKSEILKRRREAYLKDPMMEKMRKARAALPVFSRSEALLSHIRDNEVTICMAATGSGKTTQIPQLILDDYIDRGEGARCNVICTQPRRLAALSVADRVAKERGERLGMSIGYSVRFESKPPEEHGSVTFCTVGVLLKRLQSSVMDGGLAATRLDRVTHIVVDEVHERDVDTDLLLMVLKRLMEDRRARSLPLKVVLMSATIDPRLFQKYFADESGEAQVIDIPGRTYPVAKYFMEDFVNDIKQVSRLDAIFREESVVNYFAREEAYVQSNNAVAVPTSPGTRHLRDEELELPAPLVAATICHVLEKSTSGHVLVFLPGWEEISAVQRFLTNGSLPINFDDHTQYSLHVLHSTIPLTDQQVIFEPPRQGVRRVILATNIAETSITIPDVVYVIDAAKVKELRYDPDRHMTSLVSAWVGSSNLNQRAGRAGRHRSGEYYGLLSSVRAANLNPHQTVEMKRVDLSNIVMHVKALSFPGMGVEDVLAAMIEPPEPDRIAAAMKNLQMVGALDHQKNLTPLGRVLLQIPVDVQMGKLLLYGSVFRCLDKALSLAAILTNRDPFVSPLHLKEEAAAVKGRWSPKEFRSDALTILNAYSAWLELYDRGEHVRANRFCVENYLSKPTLVLITNVRAHLLQSLYNTGIMDAADGIGGSPTVRGREITIPPALNANSDSQPMLAALIALASQPKYAVRNGERTLRTQHDKTTFIHPSSINHRKHIEPGDDQGERQLYAYAEKRRNLSMVGQSPQTYLINTTRLDPMTYLLFGAYDIQLTGRGLECDEWLPVVGNLDILDDILRLKTMLESCMSRVFEAIHMSQQKKGQRRMGIPAQEDESGEERLLNQDLSLSPEETMDLESIARDTVRLLNRYSDERMVSQSQPSSLSATPTASPVLSTNRFVRSGYSTPYGARSAHSSRPSTPSRLARSFRS
ncbi:hypothetical protein F5I97DRAFT_1813120 [Phlebopus sp. FC_14]|nr:hypothetical protein F5I97DRAFT_1813120 [Phlebopus sp. FC_14]